MSVRALPLAKALVRRGHQVTLLLPPWNNREQEGERWVDEGVTIENVALPPSIPVGFQSLTSLRLARRVRALRPDVVHLFKPKAYSGLAHWFLARLPWSQQAALVVDTDDWEGPGGWNDIGDYTPLQRRFFAWQERWGLRHGDAVTVVSRTLESLVWALGVAPERVFYVPNGVRDPDLPVRSPSLDEADPFEILLYTRFFEFSVSRVLNVLLQVRERVPQAKLVVVGKGFFGEEEELLRLAGKMELRDAVAYLGWVEAEDLPQIFDRVSLAIYPFDDTLINRSKCAVKLLDLLASGVPVVADGVGQNREMIRHGETGLLVRSGGIDAFAESVVRLLEDAPFREQLGQAAARDVRARFSWDNLVDRVERAYAEAVGGR